jgi:hypothetical protein
VYLKDVFEESDDEEFKDCNVECEDNDTNDPPVLDLSHSAVTSVIADASFTTRDPILESKDIWIADTGATSHVMKHAEGGRKHRQTSVRTRGFAGETIKPDCKMDIPVTYVDINGTEKFDVVLEDIQTNEKLNYNLFSVTKMLLKGYQLKGNKNSITVWNQMRSIMFDLAVRTRNGAVFCAKFMRKICKLETANSVVQAVESGSAIAKK